MKEKINQESNAIAVAQQLSKKMNVESFNMINDKIDEITKILLDYEGVNIGTSIKGLKNVGLSVSEHFYRYEQEEKPNE